MNKTILLTTSEIIFSLQEFKDDKRKQTGEANHPTRLEIIGVSNPNTKKVLSELQSIVKNWSPIDQKALIFYLLRTDYFECHLLAYYYLEKDKKLLKSLSASEAKNLAVALDNWVLVDAYSTYILGYLWHRNVMSDNYIHQLLKSENVWERRTAVVSTVALNQTARGGTGDTLRTIAVCEKVVNEKHPMIVKALSWALRVLIKTDRQAVIGFLLEHNDKLHNQVKREVNNKLETGLKNPEKKL